MKTIFTCSYVFPTSNYMFKVNSRNTIAKCEICSKLTTKTPEWRQWYRSGVFIVNFEHISHLVLVFNFEQVNAGCLFLSDIHELRRCIQNPVEHLRWSFLWKQFMAESAEAARSYDTLLHHSVLQDFIFSNWIWNYNQKGITSSNVFSSVKFGALSLCRLIFHCTRSKKFCTFSKSVFWTNISRSLLRIKIKMKRFAKIFNGF